MPRHRDQKRDAGGHAVSRRSFLSRSGIGAAGAVVLNTAIPTLLGSDTQAAEIASVRRRATTLYIRVAAA